MQDSFKSRATLNVGGKHYEIFKLDALEAKHKVSRLPYSLKILLENMLRLEDGVSVTKADIEALASCDPRKLPQKEIALDRKSVV